MTPPVQHDRKTPPGMIVLTVAIAFAAAIAMWLCVSVWPAATTAMSIDRAIATGAAVPNSTIPSVHWLFFNFRPDQSSVTLLLAIAFGLLGSSLNTAWTMSVHIARHEARAVWAVWNAITPFVGAGFALLLHLTFAAKLFGVGYDDATLKPATIAVISAVGGMSATYVRGWLRRGLQGPLDDAQKQAKGGAATTIDKVEPASVASGSAATIVVTGKGFGANPTVELDATTIAATNVSDTSLTLNLTAAQLATPGTKDLVVHGTAGQATATITIT